MQMSQKVVVAALVGVGGAVALYYFLSRRKNRAPPAVFSKPSSPQEAPATLRKIEALQGRLAVAAALDPKIVSELAALLTTLSEEDLNEAKMNAEYVSFVVSEWIFYHTLRTKQSVTWNPTTGLIDEALSPRERELGQRIATTMRQAYWDRHLADLEKNPPNFTNVLQRLGELQTKINEYQKSKKTSLFDLELVKQVVSEGHFDRPFFHALLRAVINALYDLESPASHEETFKHLTTTVLNVSVATKSEFNREIVRSLEYLFSRLDVLEAEIANFKSTQVSLETRRKKERELFKNLVEQKLISIDRLRALLLSIPAIDQASYGSLNAGIVHVVKKLFITAITGESSDSLPESLVPDVEAISALKSRAEKIVLLASFVVGFAAQLPAVLGHAGVQFVQQPVDEMLKFLSELGKEMDAGKSVSELIDELLARVIAFTRVGITESQVSDIRKGIDQCCVQASQVRVLYAKRVATLIQNGVNEASSTVASNALGSQPWFLSVCAQQTSGLIADAVDLIAQHLHVYLPVYRDIATSAI